MSFTDPLVIKRRNRDTLLGLKKLEKTMHFPHDPVRPNSAAPAQSTPTSSLASQILADFDIPSLQSSRTSAARVRGSSRHSLAANYRPLTQSNKSRVRSNRPPHLLLHPAATPHGPEQGPLAQPRSSSSSVIVPPCSPARVSGRMSRLAGSVEQLFLHDAEFPKEAAACQTTGRLTCFDPLSRMVISSCTSSDVSGATHVVIVDAHGSPWYRHRRPRAPEPPPVSPPHCASPQKTFKPSVDVSTSDYHYLSTNLLPNQHTRYDSGSGSSSSPGSVIDVSDPITKPATTVPFNLLSIRSDLDLPALEMDTDNQENRYRANDFPLPPPPDAFDESESSSTIAAWSSSAAAGSQLSTAPSPVVLGPLVPITNILPNSVLFGTRQPKWSVFGRFTPDDVAPTTHTPFSVADSMTVMGPSSIPSPPPLLVERLSDLAEPPTALIVPTPELHPSVGRTEGHSIWSTSPELARPEMLKRESPDGAEHISPLSPTKPFEAGEREQMKCALDGDMSRSFVNKWIAYPAATKRLSNTDLKVTDYSPKKSRSHLLVPSERSAFLPVYSSTSHTVQHEVATLPSTCPCSSSSCV